MKRQKSGRYDEVHVLVIGWGRHATDPLKSLLTKLDEYRIDIDHSTGVVNFRSKTAGGKLNDNDVLYIYTTLAKMGIAVRRDV